MLTDIQFKTLRKDYFTSWKVRQLFVKLYRDCYKFDAKIGKLCMFDQYGYMKSRFRYATVDDIEPVYGPVIPGVNGIIAYIRGYLDSMVHPEIMNAMYPHVHWAYVCAKDKLGSRDREFYYTYTARKETCKNFNIYASRDFPKTYHRKWNGIEYMIQLAEEVLKTYGERDLIDSSKKRKIVFFTGSGISRESGIPTFRDTDGLWEQYPLEMVATPSGFYSDPEFVNGFYNQLRVKYLNIDPETHEAGIKPNHAHRVIAELAGANKYSSDGDSDENTFDDNEIVVITQNVDDLHERAILEALGDKNANIFDVDMTPKDTSCCEDCDCEDCELIPDEESEEPEIVEKTVDPSFMGDTQIVGWECPHDDYSQQYKDEQKKKEEEENQCCDDIDGGHVKCEPDETVIPNVDFHKQDSAKTYEYDLPIKIIHLHGQILKMCADGYKEDTQYHINLPYDKSLEFPVDARVRDYFPDTEDQIIRNKRIRPYIVWFGEDVPRMGEAIKEVENCDAFIIIGTSLQVYPAASLIDYVPYGVPIIYIDPNPEYDDIKVPIELIKMSATEGMDELKNNWNKYIR